MCPKFYKSFANNFAHPIWEFITVQMKKKKENEIKQNKQLYKLTLQYFSETPCFYRAEHRR